MKNDIKYAADKLKEGAIVCMPTETVYGLAVDSNNVSAITALYNLKHRPIGKPTSIAVANPQDIKPWVDHISKDAEKLMECFWPGPLTLIFPVASSIPHEMSAGFPSIGIRCSSCPIVKQILNLLGNAVCLTSANLAGEKEASKAQQVRDVFPEIFVVEGDEYISGTVSTIIDLSTTSYQLVREGEIPVEKIQAVIDSKIMTKPTKNKEC